MKSEEQKEKEWADATSKSAEDLLHDLLYQEPIREPRKKREISLCKIETCGRKTAVGKLQLCSKHYIRLRTGRMDELTGELRSLYPLTKLCKGGCGDKITIENEAQKATKYCDYCRDYYKRDRGWNRYVFHRGEIKYRYRNKKIIIKHRDEFVEIDIPIFDDYGEIIRHKKDIIKVVREYFHERYDPLFLGSLGIYDKYDLLNTFVKCRCGKYTSHLGKCTDCNYYQSFDFTPTDMYGDRSKNRSIEELFLMGNISCDVAMNLHESESYYEFDGRDPEHSRWWGG